MSLLLNTEDWSVASLPVKIKAGAVFHSVHRTKDEEKMCVVLPAEDRMRLIKLQLCCCFSLCVNTEVSVSADRTHTPPAGGAESTADPNEKGIK